MVTYEEIYKAVVKKIKFQFPTIKISPSDDEEGIKRPSFRIYFDNIKSSNFMNTAHDRSIPVRILFFPSDRKKYKLEVISILSQLEELFLIDNIITTESGFIIETHECESETVDGVLHFTFDLELYEDLIITDDRELMGDIELQENVNK
ncbi:MAG: DUF6838 family protein [Aminipila sp.]